MALTNGYAPGLAVARRVVTGPLLQPAPRRKPFFDWKQLELVCMLVQSWVVCFRKPVSSMVEGSYTRTTPRCGLQLPGKFKRTKQAFTFLFF